MAPPATILGPKNWFFHSKMAPISWPENGLPGKCSHYRCPQKRGPESGHKTGDAKFTIFSPNCAGDVGFLVTFLCPHWPSVAVFPAAAAVQLCTAPARPSTGETIFSCVAAGASPSLGRRPAPLPTCWAVSGVPKSTAATKLHRRAPSPSHCSARASTETKNFQSDTLSRPRLPTTSHRNKNLHRQTENKNQHHQT